MTDLTTTLIDAPGAAALRSQGLPNSAGPGGNGVTGAGPCRIVDPTFPDHRIPMHLVVAYQDAAHRLAVVQIWESVFGYKTAHTSPSLSIDKKLEVQDGLFFVALAGPDTVVGTVMAGYDGHRGWLYSLAVHPLHRHRGYGTALVEHAERALVRQGCVKINLQIMDGNERVAAFYESLGYAVEPRLSMAKSIACNIEMA